MDNKESNSPLDIDVHEYQLEDNKDDNSKLARDIDRMINEDEKLREFFEGNKSKVN